MYNDHLCFLLAKVHDNCNWERVHFESIADSEHFKPNISLRVQGI